MKNKWPDGWLLGSEQSELSKKEAKEQLAGSEGNQEREVLWKTRDQFQRGGGAQGCPSC